MSDHPEKPQFSPEIVKINPREHVRKRPGMYIGGKNQRAMHYLIYIIVDHSIQLAFAGLCDHIWITLRDNNEVCVRDNGPEIPLKVDEISEKPMLEAFMTELGVTEQRVNGFTGKFYRGMFSTGFLAINALSASLSIENTNDGYLWTQEYKEGVPQTGITQVRALVLDEPRGITITLRPDFTIFEAADFDYEAIIKHVCETAYLAAGVTITVVDERQSPSDKTVFYFPNGMADLVRDQNNDQTVLHELIHYRDTCTIIRHIDRREEIGVEFALQYNDSNETVIKSYVNTWCMDGGTHIHGLEAALVSVINAKTANQIEKPFKWDEIKMGLTVGLNLKMNNPDFESQTKINLINQQAYDAVVEVISKGLNAEHHPIYGSKLSSIFYAVIKKCNANRNNLNTD